MLFIGPVADKKFTNGYIGKKVGQTSYLRSYNQWAKNRPQQDTYAVVKEPWESGIKILDNENNKIDASAQTATFEFTRPLKTRYLNTMDIDIDRSYLVYISHGVFPTQYQSSTAYVRGATKSGTYQPAFETFKMLIDPDKGGASSLKIGLVSSLILISYYF